MEEFALEVLRDAKSWNWPNIPRLQQSGSETSKFKALSPEFLSWLIKESVKLGGTVLDQFWETVGKCDDKLKDNIENVTSVPEGQASAILFAGVDRETIDLKPLFQMAAEYFTHLAVVFLNPGGPKSAAGTPFSVTDIISMETDELIQLAKQEGFGKRKQEALKRLALERDGPQCVMTNAKFQTRPDETNLFSPILSHIVPNSIHGKPDTLKCLAMFAGKQARDLVLKHLNGVGNVANFQSDAHKQYDELRWGIEAQEGEGGQVRYIFRRVPYDPDVGPVWIRLRDGDVIPFGRGTNAERLDRGPFPLLCNVQLAVARVLRMSGAADVVMKLKEDSDDSDIPHAYVASDYFLNILDAKLHLQSIIV